MGRSVTPSGGAGRGGALDLGSRHRRGPLGSSGVTPGANAGRGGAWDLGSRRAVARLATPGVPPSGEAGRGGAWDSPSGLTTTGPLLGSIAVKVQEEVKVGKHVCSAAVPVHRTTA